ncbi:MAG: LapA family protein [Rhizobiaceae bacterium]
MVNRFLIVVIVIPIAVVLIALAVANRSLTAFTLDPFNPGNPALTINAPLFVLLFVALALGMIIGSIATWFKQGRYRKLARQRSIEVEAARASAARAARPSQTLVTGAPALPRP